MGSANPIIGPAALLASSTTPIEPMPEATTPSFEPRPDAVKPPTPNRLSAAPMPMPSVASPPMIARAVTSGPARQVFAADLRRTGRDLRPVAGEAMMTLGEAAGVGTTAVPAPVTAPIDLRQDRWPSAMVDRIERLRDAVDAVDTRIRLIPDALGSIDVAVKRDGDIVHVHFIAEQAATRTLLQDAAPRLAEAAEARGLKLGQTAVGGDGSQPNGRQPQPQQPSAPAPARPRSAAAVDEDATDTRIA
jgi:flagellar hook-length control protein FliK